MDNKNNMVANFFMYMWDPVAHKKSQVCLQVYGDYSVQLWTDPETDLLGWGWIKPVNKTKICLYINLESEEQNNGSLKLFMTEELTKEVNCVNGKDFYIWKTA